MGRTEERNAARKETNALIEICKIQQKYLPELFNDFEKVTDPRNESYITYSQRVMLGQLYFKGIAGLGSMQSMTSVFNDEKIARNLSRALGAETLEMLPHHVTANEYLERLEPEGIQQILHNIVSRMIRRKTFDDARYHKKWLIIVDATQTYSGTRKINDNCLETHHNKGTDQEYVIYHHNVLEAKIYFGNGLVCSIMSEFIENTPEDREKWQEMSPAQRKQDCEIRAFRRLAERLKKAFPKLPIIIMGDSLYAAEPVMTICRDNGWDYLIRYKNGSIPSLAEEYELLRQNPCFGEGPESGQIENAEFINGIEYKEQKVNVVRYQEKKKIRGEEETTQFQWVTSMNVTTDNVKKMAVTGRLRWKIENQGFNRQKHWSGEITHACSWDANALKNHYLILQISDFVRQLYEYFFLKANGIKRTQKNISSTLLTDFGELLTGEDIFHEGLGTSVKS